MHATSIFVCSAISVAVFASPAIAEADQGDKGKKEVQAKSKKAMESFDMLEFEAARAALGDALSTAKKHKLDKDKVVARVYLNLGIVEFAGLKDEDAARTAFASAVAIDPDIQIDVAYKTDGMAELLTAVKKGGGGKTGGKTGGGEEDLFADGGGDTGGADCDAIEGIDHTLIEAGKPGVSQTINARVGSSVGAEKVTLFYRAQGSVDFTAVPMKKGKGCSFQGEIPASAMKGEAVHYYVAAQKGKKSLASRGSSGSPNIIELAAAGGSDVDDNPLGGGGGGGGADITSDVETSGGGGKKTVFVSLALGTGGGYVTGTTEVAGSDVGCCFAPALLHLLPEIGYYFSRQMSLSAAFRMGFALGANVMGHATAAPAGLLRLRYAFDESGSGFQASGSIGGGIIRHVVKVEEAPSGMDADTTASGPFLIGAGLGYLKPISGSMNFVGEVNALAAAPVGVKELGTCPGEGCVKPHFGLQFDINLGVLLAF